MLRDDNYYFILRDKEPVAVGPREWSEWFEKNNRSRIVAQDIVGGGVRVSTVFLGLNHRLFGDGPPLLFETMVFGGPLDGEMVRYSTWDSALAGHGDMLIRVAEAMN